MLKDITLGQFFPGNSLLHKLDPRTKILMTMSYIIGLFLINSVYGYLIATVLISIAIKISQISPKIILKSLKPLIGIIIFTSILNIFYATGEEIFRIWFLSVTYEGLRIAIFMIWRIILLVCGSSLLTYTTSPIVLTSGIEYLLYPLKKIKFPVHEFSMMMTIALRFIPTLMEETEKIINAQKSRGADFESGNIMARAKALIPILIPLFVSSFRRADDLAVAMECRLYQGGDGRTSLRILKAEKRDYFTFTATILLITAMTLV